MTVSREKAKEILRHGEVRGHALTEKQQRFFGARAGGAPMRVKNAPLFEDGTKEPGFEGKDQWREPLYGPADRTVGNPPGDMANLKGFYQNSQGKAELDPPFPAPIQESDFPNKEDFSPGTKDNLKDWI